MVCMLSFVFVLELSQHFLTPNLLLCGVAPNVLSAVDSQTVFFPTIGPVKSKVRD